jgi:hypothetical protein
MFLFSHIEKNFENAKKSKEGSGSTKIEVRGSVAKNTKIAKKNQYMTRAK